MHFMLLSLRQLASKVSFPFVQECQDSFLHGQYLRFEKLSCSCLYRLNYKIIQQIWPWGVDGGAEGYICKPVSHISSGIVQIIKHNTLHSACCHLKHQSVKQLFCHPFSFHLTEPWIKQKHIRSVCLYWYQINPKLMLERKDLIQYNTMMSKLFSLLITLMTGTLSFSLRVVPISKTLQSLLFLFSTRLPWNINF